MADSEQREEHRELRTATSDGNVAHSEQQTEDSGAQQTGVATNGAEEQRMAQ